MNTEELAYFNTIINLPELFVELMEEFDLTDSAEFALRACVALSED